MTYRGPDRLIDVVLTGDGHDRVAHQREDRERAIADLRISASFVPVGLVGPFVLHVCLDGGRLLLDVRDADECRLRLFVLSLAPFRRLIKDYQLLVESYEQAIRGGRPQVIQTIDMGRRGLHDEGAAIMIERLGGKIAIDFETARRLFTLVCVLQRRV